MFVCRHVTAWHVLLSWQVLFWIGIASPGGRSCEGDMITLAGTVVVSIVQHCSGGQHAFMQNLQQFLCVVEAFSKYSITHSHFSPVMQQRHDCT